MRKIAVIQLLTFWGVVSLVITGSDSDKPYNQNIGCNETVSVYTVQPGDKLYEIGMMYGEFSFWEAIYIANADLIDNPDVIYPGQQFEIPQSIYSYKESGESLNAALSNPFCENRSIPVSSVDWSRLDLYTIEVLNSDDDKKSHLAKQNEQDKSSGNISDQLSEFREAFSAVVNADGSENKADHKIDSLESDRRRDAVQQQSERQIMMEIDGMVLDETRSKIGRDFYDVFYSSWQSPEGASNFSIRIAEQPSPSLGTIIYVEVNDTETFRMRLQPRYDFIQQAGRYAVRQTYSYLQNNDHQLQIY